MTKSLEELISLGQAPEWMTQAGYTMLSGGNLLEGETPRDMYWRVANASAERIKKPEMAKDFFDLMWKGWLGLATPVASNMGTDRGFPISCFGIYVPDSIDGIMMGAHELAMMSKGGGGVGVHWNGVRPRGAKISGNGETHGVVPFIKIYDSVTVGVSQGGVRRGASMMSLPIEHGDIEEFISIRRPQGDINKQSLNVHHCVVVSDEFMEKVENGDAKARNLWAKIMRTRAETGEPFLMFGDTVNKNRPPAYVNNNLVVNGSNLCQEIMLHTDEDHSFVCCLSSMNLEKWDEWKDTDAVYLATWFLEGVMQEFIDRADGAPGFERAVRFSKKSRPLGLGVLGFHSYLQKNMIPFDSMETYTWNNIVFKHMKEESERASRDMAREYGEPEWCKGTGMRHSHLLALAPTVSNSIVCGEVSPSIEPLTANSFASGTAKGTFIRRNKYLEAVLEKYGKNTPEVWRRIAKDYEGSVQYLDFLTPEEKEVFLTAREINQFSIIRLAASRQRYIHQGQSINLFFPLNSDPKYINQVHLEAWRQGVQTLYYFRSESALRAGKREYSRQLSDCSFCEG